MECRVLHCGKSVENYNLCLTHHVMGFLFRGAETGDTVFLAVRLHKQTLCGVRATLGEPTDFKPWEDAERYAVAYTLEHIQYAEPFDLTFLRSIGGKYWSVKYLQGAKRITDQAAIDALHHTFDRHRTDEPYVFPPPSSTPSEENETEPGEFSDDVDATEENVGEILEEVPEAKIAIMGTFQTVQFKNETDELRRLEVLVNDNFYALFPAYAPERTLLIPENRLFISSGVEARGDHVMRGIKSIPDALLIVFNKKLTCPLQINLIEYECFGEHRIKSQDKSNYLNGQIIPQLMKFASAFSIVTDKQIRDQTIRNWVDKIIQYAFSAPERQEKLTSWMKEIQPELTDMLIGRELDRVLADALRTNLKVMLIIDDLSAEQKDTITNVIRAFRLENGESIQFLAHVVRLE